MVMVQQIKMMSKNNNSNKLFLGKKVIGDCIYRTLEPPFIVQQS